MIQLPPTEDFTPTVDRPNCPICGNELIHTRIEIGVDAFHVWICDCESQPEFVLDDIAECRAGVKGESLCISQD